MKDWTVAFVAAAGLVAVLMWTIKILVGMFVS